METTDTLNLTRTWRPSTFEELIGQDLTVRLLKNTLYRKIFFPVYLLAGQRGCGKTSTARIFAAAINCDKLNDFSIHPQSVILPCKECPSCCAMRAGTHPDFIEIDAASHTGVDNVRSIIEATSFLPQLGRKKIYLIDEAHMLSKAAFNAFLKILEEPPLTVLFMLATTDHHKIIETVRSRCFQLFFEPLATQTLITHLTTVCDREEIPYDAKGLHIIAQQAEGSARDALNLIERVRLAHAQVTELSVTQTLGYISDALILPLIEQIAYAHAHNIMRYLQENALYTSSSTLIWEKIIQCLQALVWTFYEVTPRYFVEFAQERTKLAQAFGIQRLIACIELMHTNEQQFIKTTQKQTLLEVLLLKMCAEPTIMPTSTKKIGTTTLPPIQKNSPQADKSAPDKSAPLDSSKVTPRAAAPVVQSHEVEKQPETAVVTPRTVWQQISTDAQHMPDPLLLSLMKQSTCNPANPQNTVWNITLPEDLVFFNDVIQQAVPGWAHVASNVWGTPVRLELQFTAASNPSTEQRTTPSVTVRQKSAPAVQKKSTIDLHDSQKWEKTHTLLRIFPGTVNTVEEPSS